MTAFTTLVEQFSDIVWNSFLLFLLVGTGIFFTIRLRGVQVRRFGEGFRRVSYAYSVEHLTEALKRIREFLQENGLVQGN